MRSKKRNFNGLDYETHEPESQLKGGGYRGGPKRWTGKGPRPARHIPWPEIFKHHLSVVEGHERMIDMIRKHTIEGSGNWKTITAMQERCHEMLEMTKKATRDFVVPKEYLDSVPIGSSSASMYPGYSPADHIYGEASSEFGRTATKSQRDRLKVTSNSDVPQSEISQSKKQLLATRGKAPMDSENANLTPLGTRNSTNETVESVTDVTKTDDTAGGGNPFFVIDTNPTPVNTGALTGKPATTKAEKLSISADKAKDSKKDKKRKRESESDPSSAVAKDEEQVPSTAGENAAKSKKHKKEKKKDNGKKEPKAGAATSSDETSNKLAETTEGSQAAEPNKSKKKKDKKNRNKNKNAGNPG